MLRYGDEYVWRNILNISPTRGIFIVTLTPKHEPSKKNDGKKFILKNHKINTTLKLLTMPTAISTATLRISCKESAKLMATSSPR